MSKWRSISVLAYKNQKELQIIHISFVTPMRNICIRNRPFMVKSKKKIPWNKNIWTIFEGSPVLQQKYLC